MERRKTLQMTGTPLYNRNFIHVTCSTRVTRSTRNPRVAPVKTHTCVRGYGFAGVGVWVGPG